MSRTLADSLLSRIVLSAIALIILASSLAPGFASASVIERAPSDEITSEIYDRENGMIALQQNDIESFESISSWMQDTKSFIWIRDNNGSVSYYFNTPNLQQNIVNMVQQLNGGGWSIANSGAYENQESEWRTALLKYGYNFPRAIYYGETPTIQLDLSGMLGNRTGNLRGIADTGIKAAGVLIANVGDTVFRFLDFIGVDTGVDLNSQIAETKPEDFRGLNYNTLDYVSTDRVHRENLERWLEEIWEPLKESGAQIEYDGRDVFKTDLIVPEGRSAGVDFSGKDLLNSIVENCGGEYETVLSGIGKAAENKLGKPAPIIDVLRFMPYDIESMSEASRNYMGGIADPRAEMAKDDSPFNIDSTVMVMIRDLFINILLCLVSSLCMASGFVNKLCDLEFLTSNGWNPFQFWEGSIGQLTCIIILIVSVASIGVNFIRSLIAKHSGVRLIGQALTLAVLSGIMLGLFASPQSFGNLITSTSSKITSVGSSMMQTSDSFQELYNSNATEVEKSELRFWYCYFNIWSGVVTSHTAGEDCSRYEPSEGGNEYINKEKSSAVLAGGKAIDIWQADLLESLKQNDERNALRTVDHFMAPKISVNESNPFEFTVSKNESYTTPFYSQVPFGAIFLAISLLALSIIKFSCFVEFAVNTMLFFVHVARGVIEGRGSILTSLKEIVMSLTRVMFYDILLTITISLTDPLTGSILTLASAILTMSLIGFLLWMYKFAKDDFPVMPFVILFIRDNSFESFKGIKKDFAEINMQSDILKDKAGIEVNREKTFWGRLMSLFR